MKKLRLLFVFAICSISFLMSSCKKEVSPELKVHVVNENSVPLRNARVEVKANGSDTSRLVSEFDKVEHTDEYGNAYFQFKNTVLITIVAKRGTLSDSTFALLETKRQRENENVYEKTIVLD